MVEGLELVGKELEKRSSVSLHCLYGTRFGWDSRLVKDLKRTR